jgi:hypothetical protein
MTTLFMMLLASLFRFVFWIGWLVPLAFLWLLRPALWVLAVSVVLATLAPGPVHAGWLWSDHPDPKIEAANQALERAAQIATNAAQTQSSQQAHLLQAVVALSNERTHLAGHLQHLGTMANRESAWAAALMTSGPMLIAVAVLFVAAMAIWLHIRVGSHDAQLAAVLIEEVSGTGTNPLVRHTRRETLPHSPRTSLPSPSPTRRHQHANSLTEQEMPF